jgi:arginine repressor
MKFSIEKDELKELLETHTRQEILEEYRISQSTLSRWIKKHGLTKRKYGPNKLNYANAQQIREIYHSGEWNQEDLSVAFDVSQATINKIINNHLYKQEGPKVTGTADVKVGYRY